MFAYDEPIKSEFVNVHIELLRKLITYVTYPPVTLLEGLCYQYDCLKSDLIKKDPISTECLVDFTWDFRYYIRRWEKFSGNINYPIPITDGFNTTRGQYMRGNKWEGKQLELRLELLNYLINELEKQEWITEKNQ